MVQVAEKTKTGKYSKDIRGRRGLERKEFERELKILQMELVSSCVIANRARKRGL